MTKKLAEIASLNLTFDIIAPSHGAIWRDNPLQIVEKYAEWADAYQEDQVTIAYDTMWEGTAKIAHRIAEEVHRQSPDTVVKVFNIAKADKNEIMTEIFKSRAIAVGSPTVSNSILSSVAGWMEFLKQLKFKNKKAAAFGCYGWSGESVKILQEQLRGAGFEVIEENIRSQWNPEEDDLAGIPALVTALIGRAEAEAAEESASESTAAKYQCGPCGYIYDPAEGDPDSGIAPGTPFEDLPDDWCCPVCGVSKDMFEKM